MHNMKDKFANVLIEMLEHKTLDKITIKEIVKKCGVSRQAFYYYFNDIYDIIEWIFLTASENILKEYSNIDSWQFGYRSLMYWSKNHQALVINTYKSIQREYIENFMISVLHHNIVKVVESQSTGMNVTEIQKEFISKYFTLAFISISLDWINRGMIEEPDDIVQQIEILVKGDFRKALLNFEKANRS